MLPRLKADQTFLQIVLSLDDELVDENEERVDQVRVELILDDHKPDEVGTGLGGRRREDSRENGVILEAVVDFEPADNQGIGSRETRLCLLVFYATEVHGCDFLPDFVLVADQVYGDHRQLAQELSDVQLVLSLVLVNNFEFLHIALILQQYQQLLYSFALAVD